VTYDGYLNRWIVPRWGSYTLNRISAREVELWLRSQALAKSSCAKIRNIMSVLFNHGIRHEICKYNPIRLVRQSAKRKKFLAVAECQRGSAADCWSRAPRANSCLAGRRHGLADERTVCSEMAGYQLPIKRDQHHTVDRVSGSWTV